jgi:peroxiredoxin
MTTPSTSEQKPSLRPLILVLLGLVAVVIVLRFMWQDPQPPEGKRVGNTCPEVAGFDPEDKPVKLSNYKEKVVLISFWGTWCPPCLKQLPHEAEMVTTKYNNRPFAILGVAQDSADTLRAFLKGHPLPWANIVDGQRIFSRSWNVAGFPAVVLVDHNGVIQRTWLDGINPDAVWEAVERLVVEAERK